MENQKDPGKPVAALVDLALESWRFQKLFGKALGKMDHADAARFANQHRFFGRKIDETLGQVGIRLVSIEGQAYDAGAAATALNVADFDPDDSVVVDMMIEPIVMGPGGVLRTGTVMLKKEDK